ncbi:Uncharacterised protein [Sphingobacterium spiritivorum]|nr:Uncharacterised protein [Sphingobacterium spiritivorum]
MLYAARPNDSYKNKWKKYVCGGRTELKNPASGEYL